MKQIFRYLGTSIVAIVASIGRNFYDLYVVDCQGTLFSDKYLAYSLSCVRYTSVEYYLNQSIRGLFSLMSKEAKFLEIDGTLLKSMLCPEKGYRRYIKEIGFPSL